MKTIEKNKLSGGALLGCAQPSKETTQTRHYKITNSAKKRNFLDKVAFRYMPTPYWTTTPTTNKFSPKRSPTQIAVGGEISIFIEGIYI